MFCNSVWNFEPKWHPNNLSFPRPQSLESLEIYPPLQHLWNCLRIRNKTWPWYLMMQFDIFEYLIVVISSIPDSLIGSQMSVCSFSVISPKSWAVPPFKEWNDFNCDKFEGIRKGIRKVSVSLSWFRLSVLRWSIR